MGHPDVILDHRKQVGVFLARDIQAHEGKTEPFGVNLGQTAGNAARRCTAKIRMMRDRPDITDQLSAPEYRGDHHHIHDVLATAERIVRDQHVTRLQGRPLHMFHGFRHRQR